jgi:putative endonuclease
MYFVYIIYSERFEKFYVGLSADIKQRLQTHNSGKVKSTKSFIPWRVVYTEKFKTRPEAREKEKYLKSAAGRRWRKNNLGL